MSNHSVQIASFELDSQRIQLSHNGELLSEDEKLIRLLKLLAESYPNAVTKQDLLDQLWGEVVVSEASLAKLVSEARRTLSAHEERDIIKTVHGKGYRLALEPHNVQHPPRNDLHQLKQEQIIEASNVSVNGRTNGVAVQPRDEGRSYGLLMLIGLLVMGSFGAGAYFLPREKEPENVLGRWQLIDNNVVLHTEINSDNYPFCEDTVEYLNATMIQRNGAYILSSPLLEINLGLNIEYGKPLNANFSYRDGTGTTHTQLKLVFDGPRKLAGTSSWTWEMDGAGVLCKGISSMVSER